jgi:hypothetical protein
MSVEKIRTQLGQLAKGSRDGELLAAMVAAQKAEAVDPLPFIRKRMQDAPRKAGTGRSTRGEIDAA